MSGILIGVIGMVGLIVLVLLGVHIGVALGIVGLFGCPGGKAYQRRYELPQVAAKYADKILIMNDGEVVSYDSVDNTFKDVDMLQNMGLDIPQITKVLFKLRQKGFNIPSNIYTVEDAVNVVKNILIEKEKR